MASRSMSSRSAALAPPTSASSMKASGAPSNTVSPAVTAIAAHDAAGMGGNHMLHLHRFHDEQRLADMYGVAGLDRQRDDGALKRRAQRAGALRRLVFAFADRVVVGAAADRARPADRRRRSSRRRVCRRLRPSRRTAAGDRRPSATDRRCALRRNPVCSVPVASAGWRKRFCRKGILVGTPAILNSHSAR